MTTLDLDPIFVKALKLLHSKSKESGILLKQMLDDAIAQKKGQSKSKVANSCKHLFKFILILMQIILLGIGGMDPQAKEYYVLWRQRENRIINKNSLEVHIEGS